MARKINPQCTAVLDLCSEVYKYLLDTYCGLLGTEKIVIKLDKVKVSDIWEIPTIVWKGIS